MLLEEPPRPLGAPGLLARHREAEAVAAQVRPPHLVPGGPEAVDRRAGLQVPEGDHGLPVETAQKPMFEQLGVPVEHKRHVLLEGGHWPNDKRAVMREILDWYDLHQGPVR